MPDASRRPGVKRSSIIDTARGKQRAGWPAFAVWAWL